MTDYAQGGVARLQATFLDSPGGQPVDPASISLRIVQGATLIAGPWTYPGVVVRDLVGLFHYSWSVPEALPLGAYTAEWTAVINSVQRTGYELFAVVDGFEIVTGPPAGWATTEDVQLLTGTIVDSATLAQAQGVVELYAGVSYATVEGVSTRDLRLLRRAVAYQASFLMQTEATFSRAGIAAMNQDGVSITAATHGGDTDTDTFVLAPLARVALKQVSWKGSSRTMRLSGAGGGTRIWFAELQDAWLRDAVDDAGWRPL